MAHYIITGASGFLGNNLAQELINRGHKVTITLRTMKYLSAMYCRDAEVAYGDMRDKSFLSSLIKKDSIVIHCAGIMALGKENKNLMFDINYKATRDLTDVCIEKEAKKLIFISSVDAILHDKGSLEIIEPKTFEIDKLTTPYAKSKALASKYVLDRAKEGRINANVVYPTCLIGPGDFKISNIGEIILNYANDKQVFNVKGGAYNFVDIRDVVDGIIKISETAPSGEDYILGGNKTSLNNIFEILAENFGKKKPKQVSLFSALTKSFFINIINQVLEHRNIYNTYYLKSFKGNHNFSSEKAKKTVGFKNRPIEESLSDAISWYKENKKDLLTSPEKF